MLVGIEIFFLLLAVTYGGNAFLYAFFKKKKEVHGLEKLAIVFGVNMLILLIDGAVVVMAVLVKK